MRRMPVRCSPNRIMTTPAISARVDLYLAATCPTAVESAPRVTNTMVNPMMKAIEFSITLRNSDASWSFNSSTPTPEISDTYPGTSGNTHGERNETRPATKAAIGSGRFPIHEYCTFLRKGATQWQRDYWCFTRRVGRYLTGCCGHHLADEFDRQSGCHYRTVLVLLNLQAVQGLSDVRIWCLTGRRVFR